MSNSAQLILADAIVTAINAGTYSQTVAAVRAEVEDLPLEKQTGLLVAVIPGAGEETPATFDGAYESEIKIDVEIRAKVTDPSNTGTDPLSTLAQLVFDNVKAAAYFQAVFQKCEKSPPGDPDKFATKQQFATGATFTFKLVS